MCHWARIAIPCITRGVERPTRGSEVGRCVQGPAPGLQGAPRLLLPRAPSSHFGFLPPSNKSFVEPGARRRETRTLPSRGFQAPVVELLSHRGGESLRRDLSLPLHHAAGHLVAPPCRVPGEPANRSAPLKPAPGWRPLLDVNRWRPPTFPFGFHKTCVFSRALRPPETHMPSPARRQRGSKDRLSTWGRGAACRRREAA